MRQKRVRNIWLVRLVSFLIVVAACVIACRVWLNGVLGCVRVLGSADGNASYRSLETPAPFPSDDSAYDQPFPDLIEPELGE